MIRVPGRSKADVENLRLESLASEIREERDLRITKVSWRIERWNRETLLGIPHHDDMLELQTYIQALCDVPGQSTFPQHVEWPVYGGEA